MLRSCARCLLRGVPLRPEPEGLLWGFHGPAWLRRVGWVPGVTCQVLLLRTLRARATDGPRPGPTLAPWCAPESPAFLAAESAREDPRPGQKSESIPGKKKKVNSVLRTWWFTTTVVAALFCCNTVWPREASRSDVTFFFFAAEQDFLLQVRGVYRLREQGGVFVSFLCGDEKNRHTLSHCFLFFRRCLFFCPLPRHY